MSSCFAGIERDEETESRIDDHKSCGGVSGELDLESFMFLSQPASVSSWLRLWLWLAAWPLKLDIEHLLPKRKRRAFVLHVVALWRRVWRWRASPVELSYDHHNRTVLHEPDRPLPLNRHLHLKLLKNYDGALYGDPGTQSH